MKTFLFRGVVLFLLAAFLVLWFFSHEIGAKASDATSSVFSESKVSSWLGDAKTDRIVGYRLVDGRNDPALIGVEGLEADTPVNGKVEVRFRLVNKGGADFPWLRVFLMDAQGKTLRTIEFSPAQYPHGATFNVEPTSVFLTLRAGEQRFTIAPFFPNKGG
jgi:hypothetical protein